VPNLCKAPPMAPLILVIDDDAHLREVVRFALTQASFRVVEAKDGAEGLRRFAEDAPDLVVLDILMPELDGTEVCRRLRATSRVPILFLSSRDEEIDRVLGLELGGDDYLGKPFSPRELVARIKAILRRVAERATAPAPAARYAHAGLTLDLDACQATYGGQAVPLTATELGLLRALIARPGKVFTRAELMDQAYEPNTVVADRTIDSHMRRLRQKLQQIGVEPITTLVGLGYKLDAEP
jgi:two-component system OmpR family response regulator